MESRRVRRRLNSTIKMPPPTKSMQRAQEDIIHRTRVEIAHRLVEKKELTAIMSPTMLAHIVSLDVEFIQQYVWPPAVVPDDPDEHDDGVGSDYKPRRCGECDKFVVPSEAAFSRYNQTLATFKKRSKLKTIVQGNKVKSCNQIYIYGLHMGTTVQSLRAMFSRFGNITQLHVLPRMPGDSFLRALVRYADPSSATEAVNKQYNLSEKYRVRHYIPNRPFSVPPVPSSTSTRGAPPLKQPTPKERSYKFGMKLLTLLTEHPEGVPLHELGGMLQARFQSQSTYDHQEFYYLLIDRFYRYFTLSSGLINTENKTSRTLFLRPSVPDSPPHFQGGDKELEKLYLTDLKRFFDSSKAGAYLSQLPDLFLTKFGYLPKTLSLIKLITQLRIRSRSKTVAMVGGQPFWDIFLRKENDFYHLPQDGDTKLMALLKEHSARGINEASLQNAWYRLYGPLWTDCPEQLVKSIQAAYTFAVFYTDRHGGRVYTLNKGGETSGKSKTSRLGIGVRGLDSGTSIQDLLDAFHVAGPVQWVALISTPQGDYTGIGCYVGPDSRKSALDRDHLVVRGSLRKMHRRRDTPPGWEDLEFENKEGGMFVSGGPDSVSVDDIHAAFAEKITKTVLVKRTKDNWWAVLVFEEAQSVRMAFERSPEVLINEKVCFIRPLDLSSSSGEHRIIVRNLPSWTRSTHLMQRFKEYGNIVDCRVWYELDGTSKRRGFLTYATGEQVDKVFKEVETEGVFKLGEEPINLSRAITFQEAQEHTYYMKT